MAKWQPLLIATLLTFTTAPALATDLEVVAEMPPEVEVGNVAVTQSGRIFASVHQFYGGPIRAVEILGEEEWQIYPNQDWGDEPADAGMDWAGLNNTLGIQANGSGVIWFLDNPGSDFPTGRLVGWDTRLEQLHQVIYLPEPVITETPFLNDLAVDPKHEAIYISDTAEGEEAALIVVDLNTGLARRVLQGHESVVAEDIDMVIDDRTITINDNPVRIGVNPITIDPAYEWVYYGAMNGTQIYRIRTQDLLDPNLSDSELGERVETYGEKPISDGITVDSAGHVYVTDITANAIGVTDPQEGYRVLFQDDELLSWPDGLAVGPDDFIYVTVNQLHRSPVLNQGEDGSEPPYRILRFPALAPSSVGR